MFEFLLFAGGFVAGVVSVVAWAMWTMFEGN
jgi:hypothetical protein